MELFHGSVSEGNAKPEDLSYVRSPIRACVPYIPPKSGLENGDKMLGLAICLWVLYCHTVYLYSLTSTALFEFTFEFVSLVHSHPSWHRVMANDILKKCLLDYSCITLMQYGNLSPLAKYAYHEENCQMLQSQIWDEVQCLRPNWSFILSHRVQQLILCQESYTPLLARITFSYCQQGCFVHLWPLILLTR